MYSVQIQEGWTVGTQQIITFPGGQRVAIVVPPGVRPGQVIRVEAPAPPAGPTVRVQVPAGCGPGSKVEFPVPGGRKMVVVVPPGHKAGETFSVAVPSEGNAAPAPTPAPAPAPAPQPQPERAPAYDLPAAPVRATGLVLKEGPLFVRGGIMKGWKQRWFILRSDGTLRYRKAQTSLEELGTINLNGLGVMSQGQEVADCGKTHAFRLFHAGSSTEHWVAGADRAVSDEWINSIERRFNIQRRMEVNGPTTEEVDDVVIITAGSEAVSVGGSVVEQPITITIKPFGLSLALPSNGETVGKLKQRIEAEQGTPAELQRLLFVGQEMMDETRQLLAYGVGDHAEVYMVRRLSSSKPPRR